MRITGNDIPDDVWHVVATHIQLQADLYRLISVNRTFFNVVLDMKYREVRWTKVDRPMIRMLGRLQEPIIASHVRKLSIRPWFVELLFQRDALSDNGAPKTHLRRLMRSLSSYFKKYLVQRQHRYEKRRMHGDLTDALSSKEIIHFMIKAVNGMTNIIEFNFEWRDLPLNDDTRIFLTSTRTAFDTSLRTLILRARVCKFKELLAITNFNNVHELDFHFDYHPNTTFKGECVMDSSNTRLPGFHSDTQAVDLDARDLLDTVLPFINHRRTLLNSLTISSSSTVDLSDFFKALPLMQALRRFAARIYFDRNHLQDVSAILQILSIHSATLLYVELRPNLSERANDDQSQNMSEKQFDFPRLNDLLLTSPATLCGLESLEIPYVSPAKTIPLLCRSRDTLTNLCLTERFLTKDEVTEVVGIFSHRPFGVQHLHFQVENLDAPLIYMLASRLPGLFSLVLVCREPHRAESPIFDWPTEVVEGALLDWELRCLSVYALRYQPPPSETPFPLSTFFMEELDIMQQISAFVPSINYWKGYPKRKLSAIR